MSNSSGIVMDVVKSFFQVYGSKVFDKDVESTHLLLETLGLRILVILHVLCSCIQFIRSASFLYIRRLPISDSV